MRSQPMPIIPARPSIHDPCVPKRRLNTLNSFVVPETKFPGYFRQTVAAMNCHIPALLEASEHLQMARFQFEIP